MRIMKTVLFSFLLTCLALPAFAGGDDVLGYWKIIDDETGKAKSIIGIYKYDNKLYGRLVVSLDDNEQPTETIYDPKARAENLPDQPFYAGLDIIWDLVWTKDKWKNGSILDPEKAKVYDSEVWYDTAKDQLVVRGKIGPFGRSQNWVRMSEKDLPSGFALPDMKTWTPAVPRVK